jgi:hypothetical protein
MVIPVSQGSVVSAIGRGITSIIRAIAFVLESIIGAIVGVRTIVDESSASHLNLLSQVIVAIFNVITDILCCRCGKRRSTRHTRHTTHSHATHTTRARGRKGRRHAH